MDELDKINLDNFLPCPTLSDRYLIDDSGNIYSIRKNKFVAQRLDRYGYPRVNLYEGTKQYTRTVHRLVAQAFIPNPENKLEVNHIDGNKENNNIDNLEWVTSSENQKHAFSIGLQKGRIGEDNSATKYKEEHVRDVCTRLSNKQRNIDIINETGYSRSFVEKIKYRETWKHISCEYDF